MTDQPAGGRPCRYSFVQLFVTGALSVLLFEVTRRLEQRVSTFYRTGT